MTLPGVKGTLPGRAGTVPTAMRMFLAWTGVFRSVAGDAERVGIDERGGAEHQGDPVALHLVADDVHFGADDMLGAVKQVGHVDVVLDGVAGAIKRTLVDAGEVQDGFADGFGGDGPGVDAHAADAVGAFDDGDGFSEFSGIEGGLLAGRA